MLYTYRSIYDYCIVLGNLLQQAFFSHMAQLYYKYKVANYSLIVAALGGGRKSRPKRSVESVHDYFIQETLKQNNKSENGSVQAKTLNRKQDPTT